MAYNPALLFGFNCYAFFIMYIAGFYQHTYTLALVPSIGLVVDDAIVVMENIFSKIENGLDPISGV